MKANRRKGLPRRRANAVTDEIALISSDRATSHGYSGARQFGRPRFWGELSQRKKEPRQLERDHAAVSSQSDALHSPERPGFERGQALSGVSALPARDVNNDTDDQVGAPYRNHASFRGIRK